MTLALQECRTRLDHFALVRELRTEPETHVARRQMEQLRRRQRRVNRIELRDTQVVRILVQPVEPIGRSRRIREIERAVLVNVGQCGGVQLVRVGVRDRALRVADRRRPIPFAVRQVERTLDACRRAPVLGIRLFRYRVRESIRERRVPTPNGLYGLLAGTVLNGESSFVCGFHTSVGTCGLPTTLFHRPSFVVVVLLLIRKSPNAVVVSLILKSA